MNLKSAAYYIIFISLLIHFNGLSAQIGKGNEYKPLSCTFLQSEKQVVPGEAITNVLYVKNNNGITREFYLELTIPLGWKTLNSSDKIYKLAPDDSVFIPIRIVPNQSLMKGGTKYNINVFVVGTDGRAHAICSFFAGKPKITDWDLAIIPRSRIYFLNNESRAPLSVYIANKGEEEQELNLSWRILGRGLFLRSDSLNNKNFIDIKLKQSKDTVIDFTADIAKPDLNFNRVDIENYRPDADLEGRKYTLYFKAVEPFYRAGKGIKNKTPFGFEEGKENNYRAQSGGGSKSASADLVRLNSSVDFIKLSNTAVINNYGSGIIPVIWNSNLFNVLGFQPMLSNNLVSSFAPHKGAFIYANLQHFFTYYSPSRSTYQNLQGGISYFSKRLDIILGQNGILRDPVISSAGGQNTAGRGISVALRPSKQIIINGFYSQSPRLFNFNPNIISFGSSVGFHSINNKFQSSVGFIQTSFIDALSFQQTYLAGLRWKINQSNNFQGSIGIINRLDSIGTTGQNSRIGVNWTARYNGIFFDKKLTQSISGVSRTYFAPLQTSTNILFLNSRTALRFDKSSYFLQSGYIRTQNQNYVQIQVPTNFTFYIKNNLNFNFFPNFYHNYVADSLFRFNQIGLALNNSYQNINKNLRLSMNFMGGYNFYRDSIIYKPIFNANVFFSANYRNLSSNIRYTYGPVNIQGVRQVHSNTSRYPQYIFINLNKQHIFSKIRQFVFDFSFNYSWNNITYAHNLGFSPVVYYFTKNGWRFNASMFYNLNARNPELAQQFYTFQNPGISIPEPEEGTQYASNFNLQFGLRKEFGILLPKKLRKNFYSNPTFIAFLDFNGNKIKDNDEVALENMVIQLNGHEAITNEEGKAQFLNVEQKRYFYNVIPLIDLGGWFTQRTDSIDITPKGTYYVPFTKGVKINGTVLLDREKFTEDVIAELDLSKIRIFTTDTSGNTYSTLTDRQGNFNFYVPYGFYALSMDESVLSDRFIIAQNNIPIELEEGLESFYQAFFIIEKRRKVKKKKFNDKGELIIVEEVENMDNKSKGKRLKPQNEDNGIFNEDKRNGGVKKQDSTAVWRMNYDELDKRIQRLDSIINELKDKSVQGNSNNNNSQGFNQVVLMDALKKLKEEEERNTPYFIVQVTELPKGQTVPADLLDKYNSGTLRTLDNGNNTIFYFGSKFTDVNKAVDAVGVAAKNKIGRPELKVQYKGRVMTLNDYKDASK
jgi:hypothetical protein